MYHLSLPGNWVNSLCVVCEDIRMGGGGGEKVMKLVESMIGKHLPLSAAELHFRELATL